MDNIKINTEFIKLDQLLKFANIVGNGSDAKYLITNGFVLVNGIRDLRRGKKVYPGDIITVNYENETFEIKVCEQKYDS